MENNAGTSENTNITEALRDLRTRHAIGYAHCVRDTRVWVAMRLVTAVITVVMLAAGIFSASVVGSLVLGLVVALGISYMLRRGVRLLAWLGVAGGAASLVLFLMNIGAYVATAQQHPLLYLYIGAAVLDAAVQCAANGALLADKAYAAFARDVSKLSRG